MQRDLLLDRKKKNLYIITFMDLDIIFNQGWVCEEWKEGVGWVSSFLFWEVKVNSTEF